MLLFFFFGFGTNYLYLLYTGTKLGFSQERGGGAKGFSIYKIIKKGVFTADFLLNFGLQP